MRRGWYGATPRPDGADLVQLSTRVPRQIYRRVKVLCVTGDQTVQAFLEEALKAELARRRKESA